MIAVAVTHESIILEKLLKDSENLTHGAQILFTGVVRNHNQGRRVLGVSYDVHPVLAQKTLQAIAQEVQDQWGKDLNVQIVHRAGRLAVGDVSLAILVSSRHRDEAYKASRYVIEEIKNRAEIWKKEHYETGDSEWLQGHALCEKSL
jgi:molybdopterin synthase catalytic subunit